MIKVGINGLGRIGRAIFRIIAQDSNLQIVHINELNQDNNNMAYTLNYDTEYGPLKDKIKVENSFLTDSKNRIPITHERFIGDVDWVGVDVVIDCSGDIKNNYQAKKLSEEKGIYILLTNINGGHDFSLILGANEENFKYESHRVISSSICDATALAPIIKFIHQMYSIKSGSITTIHPWLGYQNLLDGPSKSWSSPGDIHHEYALGRASAANIIPKPTSAIEACCQVLPWLDIKKFSAFSYRVPTPVVGSAQISLNVEKSIDYKQLLMQISEYQQNQKWKIFLNNFEPLVSSDFKRSEYSTIIDHRWTQIMDEKLLFLVVWYDNEWGYANRVVDQVKFITERSH